MDDGNAHTTLAPPHPLAGIRILVVDGSPTRRLSAYRILQAWGATVELAPDPAAACAAAPAFSPDLVVSSSRYPAAEWQGVLRLVCEGPPALVVWWEGASPESVAELAVRLYGGGG
jgi:DNA-binding response OmpR family regulator